MQIFLDLVLNIFQNLFFIIAKFLLILANENVAYKNAACRIKGKAFKRLNSSILSLINQSIHSLAHSVIHLLIPQFINSGRTYDISRRCNRSENPYRVGPLDIDEINNTEIDKIATIDSECEDLDFEKNRKDLKIKKLKSVKNVMTDLMQMNVGVAKVKMTEELSMSRGLIKYFAKLGKDPDPKSTIDLKYISTMLSNGADINFPDRHGQVPFMEVARGRCLC